MLSNVELQDLTLHFPLGIRCGPMAIRAVVSASAFLVALLVFVARPAMQTALVSRRSRAGQAASGRALYDQQCASCHGASLDNGEFGPPLSGEEFLQSWGNRRSARSSIW